MNRAYEVITIISPELADEERKGFIQKVEKIVKKLKGQILSIEEWGKKKLAYPIQKFLEGYYIQLNFTGPSEIVKELERVFKLNEQVLRFQTIRVKKTQEDMTGDSLEAKEEKVEGADNRAGLSKEVNG